jgi:hypothetical protein
MCAARTHMCHHGTRSIYLLVRPSTCSRSHDSEIAMCGGEGGNLDTCASKGWFLRGMAPRFSSFFNDSFGGAKFAKWQRSHLFVSN